MKNRILAVGSLTNDVFLRPRRQEHFTKNNENYIGFRLGDKVRIQEKRETFGGGGANVAVGLSRFGLHTAVLGKIGDDEIGKRILKNLEKEKVSDEFIQRGNREESGFSMILSASSGERTVLFSSGANDSFQEFELETLHHFDGVCLQHLSGCSRSVFNTIRQYFDRNPAKFLSWNPGRESLEQGVLAFSDFLPNVDVLLMNKEEGMLFTGEKTVEGIYRNLFHAGAGGQIIITNGLKGATGCDRKNIYTCPIVKEHKRVDTLGAGDSFLTGTIGAIFIGKSLPEALKLGTINAAHVVAHFGAQTGLQSAANLEKLSMSIQIDTKPFSSL